MKAETKFTPGPWSTDGGAIEWSPRQRDPFKDEGAGVVAADGTMIVIGGSQDEQGGAVGILRDADAYLIAAAPELYDSVVGLLGSLIGRLTDDEIREAYGELGLDNIRRARAALAKAEAAR